MPCKCVLSLCPAIEFESVAWRSKQKIENLSSSTNVVHLTAKQVISQCRKDENGFEMCKKNTHTQNVKSYSFS